MTPDFAALVQAKIVARSTVDVNGCWLWGGYVKPHGYAQMRVAGRAVSTHRSAYEAWKGPIPDGYQVDHLCRVRHCVNPAHLEAVSCQENVRRAISANAKKTHCKHGHAFDEANTYINARGWRACRTCDRLKKQALTWEEGEQ